MSAELSIQAVQVDQYVCNNQRMKDPTETQEEECPLESNCEGDVAFNDKEIRFTYKAVGSNQSHLSRGVIVPNYRLQS